MCASQKGHVEVVDTLLQHGARVDLQNNVTSWFLSFSIYMYIPVATPLAFQFFRAWFGCAREESPGLSQDQE